MPPAKRNNPWSAPGKSGPADVALDTPKASPRELHQKNMAQPKTKPKTKTPWRIQVHQGVVAPADFFGASSVASALGSGTRDPGTGIVHPTMPVGSVLLRAELSTLLERGTFYLALTFTWRARGA